jgi:hypothetical protein
LVLATLDILDILLQAKLQLQRIREEDDCEKQIFKIVEGSIHKVLSHHLPGEKDQAKSTNCREGTKSEK